MYKYNNNLPKRYHNRNFYKNKDNDQHVAWGWNESGQLGMVSSHNYDRVIVKEPTCLGDSIYFDTKVISMGLAHTLAIDSRGKLYSCGKGAYGRLGLGTEHYNPENSLNTFEFQQINIDKKDSSPLSTTHINNNTINNYIKVNKISCGGAHSAFITENFQLFTFGKNDKGQLGQGLMDQIFKPKRVEYIQYTYDTVEGKIIERTTNYNDNVDLVSCGLNHTIFSLKDGCVYSMGSNSHSQLGFITTNITNEDQPLLEQRPKLIESINLPPKHLEQRFTNIKSISCGSNYSACIKQGNLYTWGTNNLGQCGFNPKENTELVVVKKPTLLVIYGDKSTLSSGDVKDNCTSKKVFNFIQVSCGVDHCLALTNNGQVFGWGDNKFGQIGQSSISSMMKIDTTTPIRIGESLISEFITQISTGSYHSIVLSKSGHIYSWGLNDYFQIGEGGKHNQEQTVAVPHRVRIPSTDDENTPILQISAGGRSSMAIKYYPAKVDKRPSTYFQDIYNVFKESSFYDLIINITPSDNTGNILESFKINRLFWDRSHYLKELTKKSNSTTTNSGMTIIEIKKNEFSSIFGDFYSVEEVIQDLYIDSKSYQSFISSAISEYLFSVINQELYSDVKIKVIILETGEEKIFNAHKCILVNRSEKYKTLLESSYFKESIDGVIIPDTNGYSSISIYETYLTFLYTDILNLNNDNVIELFLLSHQESQYRMKDLIEEYLFNSLDIENVSNILEIALQLNDTDTSINVVGNSNFLVEQCIYFIAKHLNEVEKTDSFNQLSQESKNLLLSNSINVEKQPNKSKKQTLDNNNNNNDNDKEINNGKKNCTIC